MNALQNICFFGASVTGQKNGYVHHFKNLTENICTVEQHGYGAMHIRDAGVCFLDKTLENKPKYCFLEWFSTAIILTGKSLDRFLDTFLFKMYQINCTPIFLLIPHTDIHQDKLPERIAMYEYVKSYSARMNIPIIDLYHEFNKKKIDVDYSKILRDSVHTTECGSKLYSELIYDYFISYIFNNNFTYTCPEKTIYCDVKNLIFKQQTIITEKITIKGKGNIIGIYQTVGPFSGIVELQHDTQDTTTDVLLWDKWCFYERNMLKLMTKLDNTLNIIVTQKQFDRSLCEKKIEWDDSVYKVIKPHTLYYIGDIHDLHFN